MKRYTEEEIKSALERAFPTSVGGITYQNLVLNELRD